MKMKKIFAGIVSGMCFVTCAVIPFTVNADTAVGNNSAVSITAEIKSGGYILGDINADDTINAVDASEILSEYARISTNQKALFTEEQKKVADVDKNGSINAVDASQVLSFYAYKATNSGTVIGFDEFLVNPPATTTKVTTTAVKTTTTTTTTVKVTPEAALVGKWLPEGDDADNDEGIAFTEDGNISLFFDTSKRFLFREDGLLYNDKVYSYDQLEWEGDNVSLTADDKTLFRMKRTEKGSGYNGKYVVYGGDMYDGMVAILLLARIKDISAVTITAEFEGEHSELWLNNFFQYKVDGNTIEVTVPVDSEEKQESNNKLEFSVDGDVLTMKTQEDGKTTVLRRAKPLFSTELSDV